MGWAVDGLRRAGSTLGVIGFALIVGCAEDGRTSGSDAGVTGDDAGPGTDAGSETDAGAGADDAGLGTDAGSDAGSHDAGVAIDAGSEADGGAEVDGGPVTPHMNTATWNVTGARTESRAHVEATNYVDCHLTSGGLLDMQSSEFAGGHPSITVRIQGYWGPGTYDIEYRPGPSEGSADVRLLGGYNYWFFENQSNVDFSRVPSTCSMNVTEPDPGARIQASISCSNLVANITSPDYDDRDAAGFRSQVSLSATFDCRL